MTKKELFSTQYKAYKRCRDGVKDTLKEFGCPPETKRQAIGYLELLMYRARVYLKEEIQKAKKRKNNAVL